jgi:hypothetical protein
MYSARITCLEGGETMKTHYECSELNCDICPIKGLNIMKPFDLHGMGIEQLEAEYKATLEVVNNTILLIKQLIPDMKMEEFVNGANHSYSREICKVKDFLNILFAALKYNVEIKNAYFINHVWNKEEQK